MHRRFRGLAAGVAGLLMLLALPALADVTVIGHYKLVNGDTLTRASYYTNNRLRTTLPNGFEIMYDHYTRRITLIDHAGKRYWEGPKSQADSIATRMRQQNTKAALAALTPEQQAQKEHIYAALTDSVHYATTGNDRKIAGYPCGEWVLTAGQYLQQDRWVARSLALPDFSPEIQSVVLATVLDPLGRGLMALVLHARGTDGLTLAGRLRFKTLTGQGEMSWEAQKVISATITPDAWHVPKGYAKWVGSAAGKATAK